MEGDCAYILESNKEACTLDNVAGTDFLKLSFFSKFGESGTFGTIVLSLVVSYNLFLRYGVSPPNGQKVQCLAPGSSEEVH